MRFAALRPLALVAVVTLTSIGCSSFLPGLLPRDQRRVDSPWSSFDEAKAAFDEIVPGHTSAEGLREIGFHPVATPNVEILTYVDVYERFVPNDGIRLRDQAPAVQYCIAVRERCNGWRLEPQRSNDRRFGNFLLDFFTFRRRVETTGWTFSSLIVLVDDEVVYTLWDGKPSELRHTDSIKPLGPLQDFFFALSLALRVAL